MEWNWNHFTIVKRQMALSPGVNRPPVLTLLNIYNENKFAYSSCMLNLVTIRHVKSMTISHMLAWGLPERTRRGGSFLRVYNHMDARFKDKLISVWSMKLHNYIHQVFLSKEKAKTFGKSKV